MIIIKLTCLFLEICINKETWIKTMLIISDKKSYINLLSKNRNKNIQIFNDYENLDKILKTKIDYVMNSISGLEGLKPTLQIIKHTKKNQRVLHRHSRHYHRFQNYWIPYLADSGN